MPSFATPEGEELASAIGRGATVCAATQRLARVLHEAWIERMRAEGREVWRTPDILPFTAWQQGLARAYAARRTVAGEPLPRILEEQQELLTWEQAALAAGVLDGMLQPQQIASAMMEAHALARAWDIPLRSGDSEAAGDAGAFLVALAQAEERWRQLGCAPGANLPWRSVDAMHSSPELLPEEIVFVGFDLHADAAFEATVRVLGEQGVRVRMHAPDHPAAVARFLRYPTFEDELHAAALHCRECIEAGEKDIGVVIPHLDTVRAIVERVFSDVLQPVSSRFPEETHRSLFELSLGPRAVEEPLIAAAFLLLELGRPALPLEQWTRILHSPFIRGAAVWGDARALLDAELRRMGMRRADTRDALHAASRVECCTGDPFLTALGQRTEESARRPAAEWADLFLMTLDTYGWPGDRPLSSREFQARGRFDELLEEFAGIDAVASPLTYAEAIGRFRLLASSRVFQVKSTSAPVQIMGMRETAGLRFSRCIVLGMNDDLWPPVPRPAAFIPLGQQRRAGVPAAMPERFLAQVRRQTELLFLTAPDVLFTCSAADGDRELLPSPMLSALSLEDVGSVRADVLTLIGGRARGMLHQQRDDVAPAVCDGEQVRGGTAVLTLQSACPFRAFAELRLHAKRPDPVEHGVRMLDRGTLIHNVLEQLWREIVSQRALKVMPDTALRKFVDETIDAVIEQQNSLRGRRVAEHLIEAERECLRMIVFEWLEVEKRRAPFVAEQHERRVETALAGLPLRVRADRIDRLDDGSAVLIDYKSGKKSPADWLTARPVEPQIPLYVQTMGSDLRAAGFAMLRRGECRFAGLREDGLDAPEFQAASEYLEQYDPDILNWEQLRARWTAVLSDLATAFMTGAAAVDPRDGDDTCRYCPQSTLCRIHSVVGEEDDDASA
jgi:ATP-dependent helicase/nuclease subunit B